MNNSTRSTRIPAHVVLLALLPAICPDAAVRGQTPRSPAEPLAIVRPARRAPDAAPLSPPSLPSVADRIVPLTLDVVVRRQLGNDRPSQSRQTVLRTRQRVVLTSSDGPERHFERNVVDPRRATGAQVIHAERTIVLYEESALRNWLGIRGWADVILLGLDADVLRQMATTPQTRRVGGLSFMRHTASDPDATVRDVWWHDDQALPSAFTTRTGSIVTTVTVERVRPGADVTRLHDPALRFPAYRVVELAEWLEGR